jgi:DNA repair photolyase
MNDQQKPGRLLKLNVIEPKSVLNASGMGGFTLNPYVGCPVGCAYCYVPHMRHNQLEDRKWGTYVDIKEGAVELLDRRLRRLRKPTTVFMSTATDPYQPVEERYRITRRLLELFARHPQHAVFILTKQALVERDADLLARLPRVAVGMSISVMDDRLARIIEPWAPVTGERLAVIERLSRLRIPTYILWAPAIVPAPMSEEFVHSSVGAIAKTGARALSLDTLNYRASQSAGLFRRLRREGHTAATKAQVRALGDEVDRQGLSHRLELVEPAPMEDAAPMLPFE